MAFFIIVLIAFLIYAYNMDKMVKDLRTEVETSDTKSVLDGDIDLFLEAALADKVAK